MACAFCTMLLSVRRLFCLLKGPSAMTPLQWLSSLVCTMVISVSPLSSYAQPSEDALSGLLTPADEPSPPLPASCPSALPATAIRVLLGSNAVLLLTRDHLTIMQSGGEELMSVSKETNGLAVSLKVLGQDRTVIAELRKNAFTIHPDHGVRRDPLDAHHLVVHDKFHHEVLNLSYLNSYAVKISGEFYTPSGTRVMISDKDMRVGGNKPPYTQSCFADSDAVLQLDQTP